jgi:hypothetical protein
VVLDRRVRQPEAVGRFNRAKPKPTDGTAQ